MFADSCRTPGWQMGKIAFLVTSASRITPAKCFGNSHSDCRENSTELVAVCLGMSGAVFLAVCND